MFQKKIIRLINKNNIKITQSSVQLKNTLNNNNNNMFRLKNKIKIKTTSTDSIMHSPFIVVENEKHDVGGEGIFFEILFFNFKFDFKESFLAASACSILHSKP